ncbi:MAG TPA: hypothetical protein VGG42_06205 [Acidobacteriaceae bacterium]
MATTMETPRSTGRVTAASIAHRAFAKLRRNAPLSFLLLASLLPAAAAAQAGKEPPAPPAYSVATMDLHPDQPIPFSAPGLAAIATKIKCGPGGDIYAIYSGNPAQELWRAPIRRVFLSSRRVTEYPAPAISGYKEFTRAGFDVAPDGILYGLWQARPQSASPTDAVAQYVDFIVKYKDDGAVDRFFPLAELAGSHFHPTSLVMFADGNSLVSGTTRDKAPGPASPGVFSAIFDPTGALRAPVTLMKLAASAEAGKSPGPPISAIAADSQDAVSLASSVLSFSSPDGNVYLLHGDRLDVISEDGSVQQKFTLAPPENDLTPVQMAAAGAGYLFIYYDHIATGAPGESTQRRGMITVANTETGEIAAIYRVSQPSTDFTIPACAVSMNDFVFLGTDHQNLLEVVHDRP